MRARIGPYRVVRILGHGEMGIVYEGFSDGRQRRAALKTLNPAQGIDPDVLGRLRAEVQAQAGLHHPNVVGVYELIEDAGEVFVALEFVEGTTLDVLLAEHQGSGLPVEEALRLGRQLLTALEYVHEQGLVHSNVKPANVILSGNRIRLMDIGIATLADLLRPTVVSVSSGTPTYMSPEQLQGLEVDHRTDLYSAAVVLFEMLVGRPPFAGGPHPALMGRQLQEGLAALKDLALHAGVCQVIATELREKSEERYQTAGDVLRALEEGAAGFLPAPPAPLPASPESAATVEPAVVQPSAPPSPQPSARPPRGRRLAAGMMLLLLSGLGSWAWWKARQPLPAAAPAESAVPPRLPPAHAPTAPSPNPPPEPSPNSGAAGISPVATPPPPSIPDPAGEALELERIRAELRRGIAAVEADLRSKRFASAEDRIARLRVMVESRSAELQPERGTVEGLWRRLSEARVATAVARALASQGQVWNEFDRDAAIRALGYELSQGYVARIAEVKVVPAKLAPGQVAKVHMRLLVVGPDPREDIPVNVFRTIRYGTEVLATVGPEKILVLQGGGIVEATASVTLPAKDCPGSCVLEARLVDPQGRFAETSASCSLSGAAGPQP